MLNNKKQIKCKGNPVVYCSLTVKMFIYMILSGVCNIKKNEQQQK